MKINKYELIELQYLLRNNEKADNLIKKLGNSRQGRILRQNSLDVVDLNILSHTYCKLKEEYKIYINKNAITTAERIINISEYKSKINLLSRILTYYKIEAHDPIN